MTYPRDLLGRGGRQFVLPWGAGRTVSTIQAAERLGVCYDTVRKMCESGELQGWPIRDIPKSPWRVEIASLDNYIARKIAKFDTGRSPNTLEGQPTVRTMAKRPPE